MVPCAVAPSGPIDSSHMLVKMHWFSQLEMHMHCSRVLDPLVA
jgi:hypothetical protein